MDGVNASGPAVRGCRVIPLFLALTLAELLGISFAAVAKQPDRCDGIAGRPLGEIDQHGDELISVILSKGSANPITESKRRELHYHCTDVNCLISRGVSVRNNPKYPSAKWFCENVANATVPLPP